MRVNDPLGRRLVKPLHDGRQGLPRLIELLLRQQPRHPPLERLELRANRLIAQGAFPVLAKLS